jgi:hypothetical protein
MIEIQIQTFEILHSLLRSKNERLKKVILFYDSAVHCTSTSDIFHVTPSYTDLHYTKFHLTLHVSYMLHRFIKLLDKINSITSFAHEIIALNDYCCFSFRTSFLFKINGVFPSSLVHKEVMQKCLKDLVKQCQNNSIAPPYFS